MGGASGTEYGNVRTGYDKNFTYNAGYNDDMCLVPAGGDE